MHWRPGSNYLSMNAKRDFYRLDSISCSRQSDIAFRSYHSIHLSIHPSIHPFMHALFLPCCKRWKDFVAMTPNPKRRGTLPQCKIMDDCMWGLMPEMTSADLSPQWSCMSAECWANWDWPDGQAVFARLVYASIIFRTENRLSGKFSHMSRPVQVEECLMVKTAKRVPGEDQTMCLKGLQGSSASILLFFLHLIKQTVYRCVCKKNKSSYVELLNLTNLDICGCS